MKFQKNLTFLLLLAFCMAWVNCSDDNSSGLDPNDPSTFIGNYDLVSITATSGDLFDIPVPPGSVFNDGQPVDIGSGVTVTLSEGTLSLTSDMFTLTVNATILTQTQTVNLTGTWSISDGIFTITPEGDDPISGSFTVSGNRVTITTPDLTIVIDKI